MREAIILRQLRAKRDMKNAKPIQFTDLIFLQFAILSESKIIINGHQGLYMHFTMAVKFDLCGVQENLLKVTRTLDFGWLVHIVAP